MIDYYFNRIFLLFFSVFFALSSCSKEKETLTTKQLVKEIEETELQLSDKEDKIVFWQDKLKQERYATDNVAKAKINYLIGRSFAPISIDSAEVYVTKALILIEDVEGFENEKTAIYNGLGNIALSRGKVFLSSFYYHKIVSILDANPSISTIPSANKIQFYLHSAQSNMQIGLYESAFELNKKAEMYLNSLTKNDDLEDNLRFRVYSQIFASGYYKRINNDSLYYYLEKIKKYSYSDRDNRFYYEHKAKFFELNNQFDSARVYHEKVLKIDQNESEDEVNTLRNIYINYCNLLQNSIDGKKIDEADSIISKLNEMEKAISPYLSLSNRLDFWKAMMNYQYQVGNLDKYQKAAETVLDMKDQVQKDAELQAKNEMQSMYQLEENKKSIKQLNQSVEITENQLQKTKYFLAITILAILVIIAILAILYYRQKSHKLQQEYEKVVLEQKLLRTQMEPHFIFNTLSTLQSLIRFQEPKKAINYLNLFSRLLRSNLELSRQDIISLEDEIESLHNYLKLQQARFKDYFTYQIQVPSDLEIDALFIPPMLIQPFVENSILHGFEGEQEWNIEIKITELAPTNQLQIEIIDNGIGINPTLKKKKKSISGDIAKERLEILAKKYKIPTDYQVFSEKGKGTKVVIKLPIIDGFKQD